MPLERNIDVSCTTVRDIRNASDNNITNKLPEKKKRKKKIKPQIHKIYFER